MEMAKATAWLLSFLEAKEPNDGDAGGKRPSYQVDNESLQHIQLYNGLAGW